MKELAKKDLIEGDKAFERFDALGGKCFQCRVRKSFGVMRSTRSEPTRIRISADQNGRGSKIDEPHVLFCTSSLHGIEDSEAVFFPAHWDRRWAASFPY
jgi:hypothetical protein